MGIFPFTILGLLVSAWLQWKKGAHTWTVSLGMANAMTHFLCVPSTPILTMIGIKTLTAQER